ncbi:hypothetical protein DPM13_00530 [Paracoccus mutanolyticus]|uniref:Rad50/SbcC-type AAA domain-containing protein n=1 Tax=Paracoccus mutanolyticus TaxID=1499308 RepID=A0ABN5MB32_9RHOB|nr:hypothetical protein DPM13_00530 [Paracoccus mutanolyticus]
MLCEPNEFGKSTFFDALHALFFERHRATRSAVKALWLRRRSSSISFASCLAVPRSLRPSRSGHVNVALLRERSMNVAAVQPIGLAIEKRRGQNDRHDSAEEDERHLRAKGSMTSAR